MSRRPPPDTAQERRRARRIAKAMKRSLRKSGRKRVTEIDEDAGGVERLRSGRLQQAAQRLEASDEVAATPVCDGLVMAVSRKGCTVRFTVPHGGASEGASEERRLWFNNTVPAAAVGDTVGLDPALEPDRALACVRDRRTWLSRPDPFDPQLERVIAANVDVALIVVAPKDGALRTGVVDRLLIAVQRGGVEAVLVVNKADLLGDRDTAEAQLAPYRALGVEAKLCVATEGIGVEALRPLTRGRTCVFVGHSGVGKSSLLNALWPDARRATGAVRERDGRGRHTTTASRLVTFADGTRVIDTPGIRSFGLWKVDADALRGWFPDFDGHTCRFRDCRHDQEPGCGVREAAQTGALAKARYEAYLRILATL